MPDQSEIEFISNHLPAMESGNYSISVTQTLKHKGGAAIARFTSKDLNFVVQGARFRLEPQDIAAVFPPAGSLGDHQNVLPHVVLRRSTLPWEREAAPGRTSAAAPTWLALLLISEDDVTPLPTPQTVTLGKQLQATGDDGYWTGLSKESGQSDSDQITVIDLPVSLLAKIMPTTDDLTLLAHVRATADAHGNLTETAVVMGNRLPPAGKLSMAYLVSVENRYDQGPADLTQPNSTKGKFRFPGGNASAARFVVLKSWRFSCSNPEHSFVGLLNGLDASKPLTLPPTGNAGADALLADGRVPVPHHLRGGSRGYGFYRGPLVPTAGPPNAVASGSASTTADALLRFDADTRMFDVSYAAAWELGRLLTLADQRISTALLQWKHTRRQQLLAASQAHLYGHLALQPAAPSSPVPIPPACDRWLKDLALLKPLPFNYLVPDERLLPTESLRVFDIDPVWMDRLWQGVLSLGPTVPDIAVGLPPPPRVSGFLLRSALVSGWPDLEQDAWEDAGAQRGLAVPLELLRREKLSPNVLICLFKGDLKAVDLHLKPEALHMGLDAPASAGLPWTKRHRQADGTELSHQKPKDLDNTHWSHGESARVLNILELAHLIDAVDGQQQPQSAQFAMQMTEGVPLRRFGRN